MSDPLRPEPLSLPEGPGVAHDAKTEDLLLTGLDQYFAGDYHQAINVWTRVLFLDRGHARARAYIERARSALAEQQRESEELLHSGVAALDRGEIDLARRLLTSSVDRGGPQELALPILARLNRLEAAVSAVESAQRPAIRPAPGRASDRTPVRSRHRGFVFVALTMTVGVGAFLLRDRIDLSVSSETASSGIALQAPDEPLPLAQPGEIALKRSRGLFVSGHLVEALRGLQLIRPSDPVRAAADRLRAEIQRELLRSVANDIERRSATTTTTPATVPPFVDPGR